MIHFINGGKGGIRTLGTSYDARRVSNSLYQSQYINKHAYLEEQSKKN